MRPLPTLVLLTLVLGAAAAAAPRPVAVLKPPPAPEADVAAGAADLRTMEYWVGLLENLGEPFRLLESDALSAGVGDASLLILGAAPVLSDAQVEAVLAFQAGGGAVLLVGMPGHLTPEGTPRDTPLPVSLAGLTAPATFDPEVTDSSAYVLRLSSPLGLAADPGMRFEVSWKGPLWTGTATEPAGYWVDWGMAPLAGDPRTLESSAAVLLSAGPGGRVAWLGAPPHVITSVNDQQAVGRRVSEQLLRWLLDRPALLKGWWPGGLQAATVLTTDVETRFETGEAIALMFHREGVRGSFFVLGDLAREHPRVVEALAENGDVGSHSMHHKSFRGRTVEDQLAEIQEGIRQIQDMGVRRVDGFRPPMEEYDDATLQAVAAAGLDFVFGNLMYDRAWPLRRVVGDRTLWQFARIVPDDYNLAAHGGAKDSDGFLEGYVTWARRMFDLGGLYAFAFHTTYLGLEENVEAIARYVRWVRHLPVWVATFRELARWAGTREAVELSVVESRGALEATVRNRGPEAVAAFPLFLLAPVGARPRVAAPSDGVTLEAREDFGHLVRLDLAAGESRTLVIDLGIPQEERPGGGSSSLSSVR
ncbi:MAG: polysaccharide deacetylase family protein [Deltaproteobacteria bacterium]|nr:polysaccharide deacetylase family protein [Deltaproteobacteria bacterium]